MVGPGRWKVGGGGAVPEGRDSQCDREAVTSPPGTVRSAADLRDVKYIQGFELAGRWYVNVE